MVPPTDHDVEGFKCDSDALFDGMGCLHLLLQVLGGAMLAADALIGDSFGSEVIGSQKNSFVLVAQLVGKHLAIQVLLAI